MTTGEVIFEDAAFSSGVEENLDGNDEKELWKTMTGESLEHMANFQRMGSNWRFVRVNQVELHFIGYDPLRAGARFEIPACLKAKKAIINMDDTGDDKCFKFATPRGFHPVKKNPQRITMDLIEHSWEYNWDGLTFPVELKDIGKFEKNNPGTAVNVYGFDGCVTLFGLAK